LITINRCHASANRVLDEAVVRAPQSFRDWKSTMKDPELDLLITQLETRSDLSIAEMDAVIGAFDFMLPGISEQSAATLQKIGSADGAMLIADAAYPNWAVHIHGRANDKDGHWRCTLRENDTRDSDAAIGSGRSPVLAQAVLAATLRLSMILSNKPPSS
jgi:hypothetical protein